MRQRAVRSSAVAALARLGVAGLIGLLGVLVLQPAIARAAGEISTVAGGGAAQFSGDGGPAVGAGIAPSDVSPHPAGGFLIAEANNNRIRRVDAGGTITTVAGTGTGAFGGDGGPATAAQIFGPEGVAALPGGAFLIADRLNSRVRLVDAAGTITTIAGNGTFGNTGNGGPADLATLGSPVSVVPTADGGYLVVDATFSTVRKVASLSPRATITLVAGSGSPGYSGDGGPATAAQLEFANDATQMVDGGVLIATEGNRIRRVDPLGTITTVAGSTGGFSGDGGPAAAAQLSRPWGIATTADGGYLVADRGNSRVRKVLAGIITTVAGSDFGNFAGDGGPATAASLNQVMRVEPTADGGYLLVDAGNARIRRVEPGAFVAPPPPPVAPPPPPPPPPPADKDGDGIPDAQDTSDASAGPTVGKTAVARVVSGDVFIRRPAGARSRQATGTPAGYVPLKGAAIIPLGSILHTTRGRVALTTASSLKTGAARPTQRAEFYGGIFTVRQRRASRPVTELTLRSTNFAKQCPSSGKGARAAAVRSRKRIARLWGNGKGRFRTRGRNSAATVRGTIWLTEERCDGTLTRVTKGSVTVRDLRAKRTVIVRAPRSYLARRAATR